jgi:DNA-binding PadR family transcriptional regulator
MDTQVQKKYVVTPELKNRFIGIVLINQMINFQKYFPAKLEQDDTYLGDYLKNLEKNGLAVITKGKYVPTEKGREYLSNFFSKYYEYLKMFDIYCAVDLEKGEFAFSNIGEDFSDDTWIKYLNEERFSDVRVAVAEFKKLDPMEIVFMSFVNEARFETSEYRWQYNLTGDKVWEDIAEICNTAVSCEYLLADDVIQNVIKKGTEIALEIIKDAEESDNNSNEEIITETTTEETEEEYVDVVEMPYYSYDYWDPYYYDPYYISLIWLPMVLLY